MSRARLDALAAIMGLCTTGCALLDNRPPILRAVNGVPYSAREGLPVDHPAFEVRIGERFDIILDAEDPEGHGLRVWWPYAPPGWDFPYDTLVGHWDVPAVAPIWPFNLLLVLEDLHPRDPGVTIANIPLRLSLPGDVSAPGAALPRGSAAELADDTALPDLLETTWLGR